MITLHGFGERFGLPELGYFAMKTEIQLKMAGLDYKKVVSSPRIAPKGELPFIEDGGDIVSDSTIIRGHLERKYAVDLDAPLDQLQRAHAWAIERMLEDHLRWTMVPIRILDPDNFERGYGLFFESVPEPRRSELKQRMVIRTQEILETMGIGRHGSQQIHEFGARSLTAFSDLLGDRPFLFGDAPTGVDATAAGILAGLLAPHFPSSLQETAISLPNVPTYVDRMMERYYPEYCPAVVD